MPDPDAYFPRSSATSKLPPPDPPIAGDKRGYAESKTIGIEKITSMEDVARAPVTVTVDGDKVVNGTQRADALALLGIAEEVLDMGWRRFVVDTNWPPPGPSWPDGGQAHQHQEDMGWRVDVEVEQDRAAGFDGLAEIDPRTAKRWVTYRAKYWYYTDADIAAGTTGPPSGFTVKTTQEPLEASGAIGASWRPVEDDEIDSTVDTEKALLAARMELGNALKEIQVAIKVADATWQGPRSEATKFKFGMEYEVIGAAWASTEAWRSYLHDLGGAQRDAQEHSEALKRELGVEVALLLVPSLAGRLLKVAFSAGRATKTALAGSAVVSYAQKIGRIVAPLRAQYGLVFDRIRRSSKALFATRVLARGAGGLATTAAVNKAGGRQTTTEDWLIAFGLATVGHTVSEGAAKVFKTIKAKHGVNFTAPVIDASKSVADGGAQTAVKKLFAEDALSVSFALGVGSDAARGLTESRLKKHLADELRNVPNSVPMQRAQKRLADERRARDPEGKPHGPLEDMQKLDKYINEEITKTVNRQVDPLLDFAYGVSTQAAEKAHETMNRPAPSDLPRAPSGTVAQPVGK
jgi:hypothetical protein